MLTKTKSLFKANIFLFQIQLYTEILWSFFKDKSKKNKGKEKKIKQFCSCALSSNVI